jgi:undecaprenyl-diphosphatase
MPYGILWVMNAFHAIFLGIIEGLTEFLPVSSTGHLIVASYFLHIKESVTLNTFEIVVQLGAILAVVVTYYKKLFSIKMIQKLIVAFIPTGIIGVVVYPFIKYLLQNPLLVAVMLIVGGVIILFVEKIYHKKEMSGKISSVTEISYLQAFTLGLYQTLAIIPGVSRSGAMIVGGLLQGLPRTLLVEFTFLLAVPTMIVATLYTILKKKDELSLDAISPILLGTVVSFIVALLVVRYALSYIRKHSFSIFGWYRIIVGIILLYILM